MENFIKWREEQSFWFINKQVENILNSDSDFNKNYTAKRLFDQIEIYQKIINVLLLTSK